MEVQGSLMMAFFLMVVISLHLLHTEATKIDLPSARNRRSEFASNINTPRTSFVGIETHDNDQLTSNINQNTKAQLRRQSESASNITSPRTSFVGIETNDNDQLTSYINQNIKTQLRRLSESASNITSPRTSFVGIETNDNDQLTSYINQNIKTQLRKSDKYCGEDNDGKCMKKKEIKECLGKINKKFKCSNKKEICCEEDPLKSQIDNLEMEQNATHDFMIKLETNLDHLETEQNTTFDFIKKLETQLDNIEKKLLAKNPTTITSTPGVTTTKTSTPGVTTTKTSTPEVTTTKTSTPAVTTTPTPITTCEDLGGVKIGHQCLKFRDEVLNWDNAKAACASSGSQLAILEDPVAVINYKDETYGGTQFWVGGSDTLNDGSWVWLNGKPFDHSFPWAPSEPNGGTRENCVMTWGSKGYNDESCLTKLHFICELGGSK